MFGVRSGCSNQNVKAIYIMTFQAMSRVGCVCVCVGGGGGGGGVFSVQLLRARWDASKDVGAVRQDGR